MAKKQTTDKTPVEKYRAMYEAGAKSTFADLVAADQEMTAVIDYAIANKHSPKRAYEVLKGLYPDKIKSQETYKNYVRDRAKELADDAFDSRSKAELLDVINGLEKYRPLIDWANNKAATKNVSVDFFIKNVLQSQS